MCVRVRGDNIHFPNLRSDLAVPRQVPWQFSAPLLSRCLCAAVFFSSRFRFNRHHMIPAKSPNMKNFATVELRHPTTLAVWRRLPKRTRFFGSALRYAFRRCVSGAAAVVLSWDFAVRSHQSGLHSGRKITVSSFQELRAAGNVCDTKTWIHDCFPSCMSADMLQRQCHPRLIHPHSPPHACAIHH